MEALVHALVFGPREIVLAVRGHAALGAPQRDLLLVLAGGVVALQLLVEDVLELAHLALLNVLINLTIEGLLTHAGVTLLAHILTNLVQNALCVHHEYFDCF